MIIEAKSAYPEDYARIRHWFDERGLDPSSSNVLPPVGVIVSINRTECACAWLYTAEAYCGHVGFLHYVATNPDASTAHRALALKRGMECIEEICQGLGIKGVFGTINDKRFLNVARKLGWEPGQETNHVKRSWA